LLNFWATWCPACVAEIPDLVSLYQKYATDGLVIVGVSLDDSPDDINPPTSLVSAFAAGNGMTYPVLMDQPSWGAIEESYGGIPYIPATFVIDRGNHISQSFVGSQTYSTFEQAVLPLLYANLALNLAVSNGQLHVTWPATQAAFVLESATDLSPGAWTPVSAQSQSDGVNQFVDLPIGAGRLFFRLSIQ
jgi:thiol-disulfide isomerase/thioredoxin